MVCLLRQANPSYVGGEDGKALVGKTGRRRQAGVVRLSIVLSYLAVYYKYALSLVGTPWYTYKYYYYITLPSSMNVHAIWKKHYKYIILHKVYEHI